MSVSFKQSIGLWGGGTPQTSGNFTPNAAGDTIVIATWDYNNGAVTLSYSGSSTGTYNVVNPPGSSTDGNNNTWGLGALVGSSAATQTATVNSSPSSGNNCNSIGVDYAGVVAIKNGYFTEVNSPGTGTGAIAGVATVVATGDVMLVLIGDASTNQPTYSSPAGTERNQPNGFFQLWDFAGAGSSLTPTFTVSAFGTDNYIVYQCVLSATGVAPTGVPTWLWT